ncbi:hypothetical protein [Stackebrandtia albiflava]|nr:hypothetical protein [Stackebrandtia albiflava]
MERTVNRTPDRVVIRDRIPLSAWLWAAAGIVIVGVTVLAMIAAGGDDVMVRDRYAVWERETWAWTVPLYAGVAAVGYPLVFVIFRFRRLIALVCDRDGIVLRDRSRRRVRWTEIDRLVVWRRRTRRLGVPGWAPQVGVVLAGDRARNFQREAAGRTWSAADLRPNGVPEWLPGGIQKHSVRLSPARAKDLAAAVARYAPSVPVIDARDPGGGERVAP